MNYVMSDIHGRIDLFDQVLDQINLQDGDMLYVLGDCIDRGGGLEVLQRIMQLHDEGKATMILGNHEVLLLFNLSKYLNNNLMRVCVEKEYELAQESEKNKGLSKRVLNTGGAMGLVFGIQALNRELERQKALSQLKQGINDSFGATSRIVSMDGYETVNELYALSDSEQSALINFIGKCQEHIYLDIDGKHYLFVHGGLADTAEQRLLIRENYYSKPNDKNILTSLGCDPDTTVIFGHSTTRDINILINHTYIAPCKIWFDDRYHDKIGIDCGACYPNGQLGCLRLEDMKEFYVRNTDKFVVSIDKLNTLFTETIDKCKKHNTANA